MKLNNVERHAAELLDLFVDCGPLTSAEACSKLQWSKGRFGQALRHAREHLCGDLGLTIPHPTPETGWRYEVTTEWQPVEAGASYSLGMVESRLRGIARDVAVVKPHLTRGSKDWRRANFLDKHLNHVLNTLAEINDG